MSENVSTVTLEDLEFFFGVNAEFLDPNAPWPYTQAKFEVHNGLWSVRASLYIASLDVAFSISIDGHIVYELDAQQAQEILVHRDTRSVSLEITLSDCSRIFLRLSPTPSVHQELTVGT